VAENVAVPLTLEGWPDTRIRQRVDEVLELVELPGDVRDRRPAELSGGQQQRVGVARALAASPRVMLLDEPFGALDPVTRDRLQQSLLALRQLLGLTAILVTHDMTEALLLADRLGVMREGRLVQVGSPADLLRSPADDGVAALFDTPRRQVRVLDTRLGGLA
jgi:osmoprotectant transport system ATP-binding protein